MRRYAANNNEPWKKQEQGQAEKYSIFVNFGSNVRTLVLLTFKGDVNRQHDHKIYSLKFDEIWQKPC